MTKIRDKVTALNIFVESATRHAEATKQGDYIAGNKNYESLIKAVTYLKEQNIIVELLDYLEHENIGIRLAAATFLLKTHEKEGIKVLEEVANSSDFFSFIAETTLNEWKNGNLKI